jgi:hypothetical protein
VFTPEKNLNEFQTLYVEKTIFSTKFFCIVMQILCI